MELLQFILDFLGNPLISAFQKLLETMAFTFTYFYFSDFRRNWCSSNAILPGDSLLLQWV